MQDPDTYNAKKEEFYRLCFENSTDITCLIDKEMMVICVSPSIERILGYQPDEYVGISILKIEAISDNYKAQFFNDLSLLLSGQKINNKEYEFISKSGSKVILEFDGTPILKNNDVDGIILSARDITAKKQTEIELKNILENLRKSLDVIIKTISLTVESRDPYTAGHQRRVADLARSIGEEMNLPKDVVDGIRMSGVVHDVGKIFVPSEILSKPGKLHFAEIQLIKIHPILGFDILSNIDFPWPVAATVLQHHERIDGSGYPFGLSGEHIITEAKIIGVADVVEALATHRPYRASLGIDEALYEIGKNSSVMYDPEVVDVCKYLFQEKGYEFQ